MPDSLPDPAPPSADAIAAERVLILDFGSQVTQLIARRLRESGVYCEIWPFNADPDAHRRLRRPRGIILSGGPASVHEAAVAARARRWSSTLGVPVLGICYGQQADVRRSSAARSQRSDHREFGRAFVDVDRRLRAVRRRLAARARASRSG